MVVEAGAGDVNAVRGEGDVVDLFAVAEQAGKGFVVGGGGFPEVHGAVIASGSETFDDLAIGSGGFLEAYFRSCDFLVFRWGNGASVVVVGGAKDRLGGEGQVVDPMGVRG